MTSLIESIELDNGLTAYVQTNKFNSQITISFDDSATAYSVNIERQEAKKLASYINKLVKAGGSND